MRAGALGIALGSLCFLLAFSGCGGGGGSSGTPAIPPVTGTGAATTAPQQTASPAPNTGGAAMVYSGTLTQSFQTFPEIAAPSASPEPVSTTTQHVVAEIAVQTNQSFNGNNGLIDLRAAETDTDSNGLKTTTSTTDTFESTAQNGSGSKLLEYGSLFVDESGDRTTSSYGSPLILDQLPDTAGAQWTNSPAASIQQALAGNATGSAITVQRTVHSDGTYAENTTYPPGYSAPGYTGVGEIQENTDGSGTFAFVANGGAITIEYSIPVPQPTGSPLITIAEFAGLDPTPANAPSASFQLPAWYGSSPQFFNETDRDLGQVPVPASCALSSQFPQSAYAIAQTIDLTDVVLGYTEHRVTTNYVSSSNGTLCSSVNDVLTLYYDFNGDQAFVFTQNPPLEIDTVSETLALAPTTTQSSQSKKRAFDTSAVIRATFDRALSDLRTKRERALIHAIQQRRMRGGAQ
jgi:hypothetical protein